MRSRKPASVSPSVTSLACAVVASRGCLSGSLELPSAGSLERPSIRSLARPSVGSLGHRLWSSLLAVCLACSCSPKPALSGDDALEDPDAARYRLLLRENPVDSGQAFRCYGQCQAQTSPQGYLQCLAECPGFEVTQGMRCASDEVPPVAACFTVRQAPKGSEPTPGWVVLGVVANVMLMVTLASVCASSSSQCGYGYLPPPGSPPPF